MSSLVGTIGTGILSRLLTDALKSSFERGPDPLATALQRTAATFPEIEGLTGTLEAWLGQPETVETLKRYLLGYVTPRDVPIDELAKELVRTTRFFTGPSTAATANEVVAVFLAAVREEYLRVPTIGTVYIANQIDHLQQQFERMPDYLAHLTISGGRDPGTEKIDSEIDEARQLIQAHESATARVLLQRIKAHSWGNASDWQKFRITTNLAATYLAEGSFEAAARLYLDAKQYAAGDEQALANEALAYDLLGDSKTAFKLTSDLLSRFPTSSRVLSVWIHAAPASLDIASLQARIPVYLQNDGEIALALAYHALSQGDLGTAEEMARKATAALNDRPPAWLLLGQILEGKELKRLENLGLDALHDFDNVAGKEIESYISRAIDLATDQKSPVLSEAYAARGAVRQALGDSRGRETDLELAYSLAPDRPIVMKGYAGLLVSRGEMDRAVDVLRALNRKSEEPSAKFLLAATLQDRALGRDREDAAALFRAVAESEGVSLAGRRLALSLAVDCLLKIDQPDAAEQLLEKYPPASVGDAFRASQLAQLHITRGETDRAKEEAEKARVLIHQASDVEEKRLLAQVLSELGHLDDAYPLWRSVYVPGKWNASAVGLMNCVSRLGRDKEALDLCRELRQAGVRESSVREYELFLLEKYDISEAIVLLQEQIREEPSDRKSRVHLSLIGIRLDRPDLIDSEPEHLPQVDAVTAHIGRGVVQVLQHGGRPNDALVYAYELLRRHFDQPEAHLAYVGTLAPLGPQPNVEIPEEVRPGVAVSYKEQEHTEERWIIVEDSRNPELSRDEYPLDHPVVQRILGKKAGEEFVLAEGTVQDRMARIQRVMSKYVFRFQDCMNRWQVRFPATVGIESVTVVKRVTGVEEYDFSAMQRFADMRHERREYVLEQYRSSTVPLHYVGAQFGASVFDAIAGIAQDPQVDLRCCNGSEQEKTAALAALNAATSIVIDGTTLGTLGMLDDLELLAAWPQTLIISLGTLNALREEVADLAKQPEPAGYVGRQGTNYIITEERPEDRKRRIEKLRQFVSILEARCLVEPCTDVASLPPQQRKVLIEMLGHHGVESILLARATNSALWTDDWVVAGFATGEYGLRRIWTQIALAWLYEKQLLEIDQFHTLCANLIGWRYSHTGLNVGILAKCADLAKWEPDAWPLKQAIDRFADVGMSDQDALVLAAGFVQQVHRTCFMPQLREAIVIRILEVLFTRPRGLRLVDALISALPIVFGLDVVGAGDALKTAKSWRRAKETNIIR